MKLVDAYTHPDAPEVLWKILAEREPHQSISHHQMPTWKQHLSFIASRPYPHWYLIDCGDLVGTVYLTAHREIGIGILRRFRGMAYGKNATTLLMQTHPGERFLANINPMNRISITMFEDMGFRLIQQTYALEDSWASRQTSISSPSSVTSTAGDGATCESK